MSWLISKALLESLPCLQALVEEYSEGISLDGEPSALSSGKPTQLPSWCSDKTMANCQLSQSGMTFKPLTEDLGEAVLMSFLEAFPVRTLAAPARAKASKETDLPCGNTWRESLEKFDLDMHTWKTHQCLWDEDLQPSSVILPKWGMMQSGVLWERTTLPRLTSGTESGLSGSWPTPASRDVAGISGSGRQARKGYPADTLPNAVHISQGKSWPTPAARDYKGANSLEHCEVNGTGRKHMDQLPNAVAHGDKPEPSGALNPTWVEWLMGWPIGWTSMDAIEELDWRGWETDPADEGEPPNYPTPQTRDWKDTHNTIPPSIGKTRGFSLGQFMATDACKTNTGSIPRVATGIKHRVGRLKAIGNGQVPQVAAMAWNILNK